jgi:hypothetical protein
LPQLWGRGFTKKSGLKRKKRQMGKYKETQVLDTTEVSVEDFYKSIDPVLKQLDLVNFQLELLKGTLGVIEKNIEVLLEDEKTLDILIGLISNQTEALKDSTKDLSLN